MRKNFIHSETVVLRPYRKILAQILLIMFLFCLDNPVLGIILHPNGEPNPVTWIDRPQSGIVGRWCSNGSCVAVSRNCVITTQHQGGTSGQVVIDGKSYNIAQIWNHSTADLRVVKLENANLRYFVKPYTNTNETNKEIRIGGYGRGRGTILQTSGITYGYAWDGSSNTTLRWCTNKINDTSTVFGAYTSDILIADFDGLGEGNSTIYEGTIAEYDSGGGWFIYDGGEWKVAGLSRGVEIHYAEGHEGDNSYLLYEAWFRERSDPNELHPDYLDSVRISSYATWITDTIPEVVAGDLNGDDQVDFRDFSVFANYWLTTDCQYPDWCLGTDYEPDGDVDFSDLAFMLDNWLNSGS
jgi:hypothetical protein